MRAPSRLTRGAVLLVAVASFVVVPATVAAAATPFGARPVLGVAVQNEPLESDATYRNSIVARYKTITPEAAAKWSVIQPERGQFDFAPLDAIVNFATAHGLKVHGLPLVWWLSNPAWLTHGSFTPEEFRELFVEHIRTVVSRYAGRISVWYVTNETINLFGAMHDNLFLRGVGPDYVDLAFHTARAADPTAKLYYNDLGNEVPSGGKYSGGLQLVAGLKARGVPIDGVGFQVHTTITKPPKGGTAQGAIYHRPSPNKFLATMRAYANLGVEVAITEMDVRLAKPPSARDLRQQAQVYRGVLNACVKAPNCVSLTTWGFTDRYSWLPSFWGSDAVGAGLPFDANYQPKPAAKVFFGKI